MTPTLDEIIRNRRSIRKFSERPAENDTVRELVDAARFAPSPSNSNPVRVVRIVSEDKRRSLEDALTQGREHLLVACESLEKPKKIKNLIRVYYRYSAFMLNAPVLLGIFAAKIQTGFGSRLVQKGILREERVDDADVDVTVGCAVMSMLLKAEEKGLGACVLTAPLVFAPHAGNVLGVTDMELKCFLAAGYKDESPPRLQKPDFSNFFREV